VKIHIVTKTRDDAWGGANQFLKALKKEFVRKGLYSEEYNKAGILLFNSYQDLGSVLKLKLKYPNKIFVHRLGPIFKLHRRSYWSLIDKLVIGIANNVADGVVLQSKWSKDQSIAVGFKELCPSSIIGNTADPGIFKNEVKIRGGKIKLIAVSWSNNPKKGLDYYKYLDKNLDWNKYQMTFVGNCVANFKNIIKVDSLNSLGLSAMLNEHDIFISPAQDEAASNAIVEALSCGLPVVAIDSGSNREVVQNGGEFFCGQEELVKKIDLVAKNIEDYCNKISVKNINQIAEEYIIYFNGLVVRSTSKSKLLYLYIKIIFLTGLVRFLDKIYN
jgi:glycosyltransferase involved in cell wall biosynthesis